MSVAPFLAMLPERMLLKRFRAKRGLERRQVLRLGTRYGEQDT
jgi:hypothetical protein